MKMSLNKRKMHAEEINEIRKKEEMQRERIAILVDEAVKARDAMRRGKNKGDEEPKGVIMRDEERMDSRE